MTYASISVDRRAEYYARCAELIAADPLDFYTRAEKGRKFLASRLNPYANEAPKAPPVSGPMELVLWLNDGKTSIPTPIDPAKVVRSGARAA
jgi:hypothetical protein